MRFRITKPMNIPDEALCAVIMLAALFGNISPVMGLLSNCIGLGLAMVILMDCIAEKKIRLLVWILFGGSLVLGLFNVMFVGQHAFQKYVIAGVTFFAVGLYFNVTETLDYNLWRFVFIVAAIFVMFNWLRSPDGYQLFYQQGRNYVSVFLLVYLLPMQLAAQKNNITIPLAYYILIVICCISAIGRGGIVCSALLLAAIASYRFLINEKLTVRQRYINIALCMVLLAVGVVILFRHWDKLAGKFLSRFVQDNTGSDGARMRIITEYLANVDTTLELLLGTNSRDIPYLSKWSGNIHNTYLMTHASYGLIGMIVVFAGVAMSIILLLKEGQIELGILIAVIMARSMIDTIFQAKPGDMVAWYCIIYSLNYLKIKRKVYFFVNRSQI